jgi:hypothetical protein
LLCARQRRRFGYRRIHTLLEREDWQTNVERVYEQTAQDQSAWELTLTCLVASDVMPSEKRNFIRYCPLR